MPHESPAVLARLAVAAASLSTAASLHAQVVRYVDDDAPPGGNGTSWNAAFKDLTDALAGISSSKDEIEIRIAQGMYKPDSGTGFRSRSFAIVPPSLHSGVTVWLRGGFAGRGAINPDLRDPGTFVTVLSGDLNGDDQPGFVNRADNSYSVVLLMGLVNGSVGLSGMTIRGGNASAESRRGGGVFVAATQEPTAWGPVLEDCRIVDNQSADGGGGYAQFEAGRPSFTRCEVSGNVTPGGGGGLAVYGVDAATMTDCVIRGNTAGTGGGLLARAKSGFDMRSCDISLNIASDGGGVASDGPLDATNCVLSRNMAGFDGGGVHFRGWYWYSLNLVNCTVAANTAARGGALFIRGADTTSIGNSILWNNPTGSGQPGWFDASGGDAVVAHSNVHGGQGGFTLPGGAVVQWGQGNLNIDPGFQSLATDLRLSAYSPCVDSGYDGFVPPGVTTDVEGNPRFRDDRWMPNAGPAHDWIVDMGAYEAQDQSCAADCNADGALNLADFGCFQTKFSVGNPAADCNRDGLLNLADFGCFQTKFALGCP